MRAQFPIAENNLKYLLIPNYDSKRSGLRANPQFETRKIKSIQNSHHRHV